MTVKADIGWSKVLSRMKREAALVKAERRAGIGSNQISSSKADG